ncbi:MAG: dihydropteroate synthase [Mariprofundaceae bacterium]
MVAASRWHVRQDGNAWIMGVLNCTPDSFSDGGKFTDAGAALRHARAMIDADADIIDVGGESTRPGATPVSVDDEIERVIPVVAALAGEGFRVSIDTSKAELMRQALAAGAVMVNDVTALRGDEQALAVVADSGADVCLMHMQGEPRSMQETPCYDDVVGEVEAFFHQRLEACLRAGIGESSIILDPGIGFGKRQQDNLALIAGLPRFKAMGFPLLLGVSRKSFLGAVTGASAQAREFETAAAVTACVLGGADILRVHDVPAQVRAIRVASAIRQALPAG